MLNPDTTWFEEKSVGELSSKIAENTMLIVESLGDNLEDYCALATCLVGVYYS